MSQIQRTNSANFAWLKELKSVIEDGSLIKPRGQVTRELLQQTSCIDMRKPVITIPERKLSTKFLGGEAYWILSGDNRVKTIAPYNKNIVNYSDDGETFFGAYGPRIMSQIDYAIEKLISDRDSRQAVIAIWKENPPETKDVPCTIAVHCTIRENKLNCHVFMRSNDLWLGYPYDVFNFSMLAHLICCRLNSASIEKVGIVTPGTLYHTASSRHIYEQHFDIARQISGKYDVLKMSIGELSEIGTLETPHMMYTNESHLMTVLDSLRNDGSSSNMIWWK